jgi:hypothetical protein
MTVAAGAIGGLLAWLTRLERRMSGNLTRSEHQAICETRNAELKCDLEEIKVKLERQDDRSADYRSHVQGALSDITTKLAVFEERIKPKSRSAARKK